MLCVTSPADFLMLLVSRAPHHCSFYGPMISHCAILVMVLYSLMTIIFRSALYYKYRISITPLCVVGSCLTRCFDWSIHQSFTLWQECHMLLFQIYQELSDHSSILYYSVISDIYPCFFCWYIKFLPPHMSIQCQLQSHNEHSSMNLYMAISSTLSLCAVVDVCLLLRSCTS